MTHRLLVSFFQQLVMSKCKQCQTSCDVTHLYQAVEVTVQPRPHHITCFILLLILAMLCDALPVWGEYPTHNTFLAGFCFREGKIICIHIIVDFCSVSDALYFSRYCKATEIILL